MDDEQSTDQPAEADTDFTAVDANDVINELRLQLSTATLELTVARIQVANLTEALAAYR